MPRVFIRSTGLINEFSEGRDREGERERERRWEIDGIDKREIGIS